MDRAKFRVDAEMSLRIKNLPMTNNIHSELLDDAQKEIGNVRGIRLIWDADRDRENGNAVAYVYFWDEYRYVKHAALRYDGHWYSENRPLEAQKIRRSSHKKPNSSRYNNQKRSKGRLNETTGTKT